MTEFELAEQQRDLQVLRDFVPSWVNAPLEPFIPPADSDVRAPVWGKTLLPISDKGKGEGSEGNDLQLVRVIAGRENGSTFTPCIVNAIGPAVDL